MNNGDGKAQDDTPFSDEVAQSYYSSNALSLEALKEITAMKSLWFKALSKLLILVIMFGQSQSLHAQQNDTISVFAVHPAWVSVQNSAGNTVQERILDACEALSISVTEMPLKLKAGNSSSIYIILNEAMYGPIGIDRSVATTPLYPSYISENFVQIDGKNFENVSEVRNALNCEPNIRNDYSPSKMTTAKNLQER